MQTGEQIRQLEEARERGTPGQRDIIIQIDGKEIMRVVDNEQGKKAARNR